LYAARGRLIPFNSDSPTGSTCTALHQNSGANQDLPRLDFVHSREATLDTVPMAA
jgi:hypothetical protein